MQIFWLLNSEDRQREMMKKIYIFLNFLRIILLHTKIFKIWYVFVPIFVDIFSSVHNNWVLLVSAAAGKIWITNAFVCPVLRLYCLSSSLYWSGIWMVGLIHGTKDTDHLNTKPFEPQTSKNLELKCFRYSIGYLHPQA